MATLKSVISCTLELQVVELCFCDGRTPVLFRLCPWNVCWHGYEQLLDKRVVPYAYPTKTWALTNIPPNGHGGKAVLRF